MHWNKIFYYFQFPNILYFVVLLSLVEPRKTDSLPLYFLNISLKKMLMFLRLEEMKSQG